MRYAVLPFLMVALVIAWRAFDTTSLVPPLIIEHAAPPVDEVPPPPPSYLVVAVRSGESASQACERISRGCLAVRAATAGDGTPIPIACETAITHVEGDLFEIAGVQGRLEVARILFDDADDGAAMAGVCGPPRNNRIEL